MNITSAVRLNKEDFKAKWHERFERVVSKVGNLTLVWVDGGSKYIVSGYNEKNPNIDACGIAYGFNPANLDDRYIYNSKSKREG